LLDHEGELAVVIKRDIKDSPGTGNFPLSDCILGYTAGNGVLARNFQLPDVWGGQFYYAKSFDEFTPIGPCIVSPEVIPGPKKLQYVTRINGVQHHSTGTDDMIWSVKEILIYLTRDPTLRAGTVIMTGTSSSSESAEKSFWCTAARSR
jgi:2-keto-4-pentenoate hydratase/2-oxohepta-3-ene-1,7-dioic acid hydratase in catechol pathway